MTIIPGFQDNLKIGLLNVLNDKDLNDKFKDVLLNVLNDKDLNDKFKDVLLNVLNDKELNDKFKNVLLGILNNDDLNDKFKNVLLDVLNDKELNNKFKNVLLGILNNDDLNDKLEYNINKYIQNALPSFLRTKNKIISSINNAKNKEELDIIMEKYKFIFNNLETINTEYPEINEAVIKKLNSLQKSESSSYKIGEGVHYGGSIEKVRMMNGKIKKYYIKKLG